MKKTMVSSKYWIDRGFHGFGYKIRKTLKYICMLLGKPFFPEPGPAGRLHETQAVFVGASEEEARKRKRFCDNFTMGTSSDIRNGE